MSIQIKDLAKNYGHQIAVNHISFTVDTGEIVGFLGPNGAGKSTTMKMITGYIPADSGKIMVCGLPAGINQLAAKKKIGYLPEANPLYMEMYVREYLQFIAELHGLTQIKTAVQEAIKQVGLSPESHKKISALSKGYKQRVGLAAAIIHNPEVLILDEPTSGLDPNQIVEIRQLIKDLSVNKTILFSTHIMQEVEAICHRVLILNKGNIVADESLQNLKQAHAHVEIVKVSFSESIALPLLQGISSVTEVVALRNRNYNLSCTNASQVKKELLQLALQHQLNIESLQTGVSSLEEIFKSYTQ